MGTTSYFEKEVKDSASEDSFAVEVGTTNFAGDGPQMFLKLGTSSLILNHEDAKAFCEGVEGVAHYFGNWKDTTGSR